MTERRDFADHDGRVSSERFLEASVEWAWAAITDPRLLSRWFVPTHIQPRIGGTMVFTFPDHQARGIITRFEPPRLLEFTWQSPDTSHSTVRIELVPEPWGCRVRLTHSLEPESPSWRLDQLWSVGIAQLSAWVSAAGTESVFGIHHEPLSPASGGQSAPSSSGRVLPAARGGNGGASGPAHRLKPPLARPARASEPALAAPSIPLLVPILVVAAVTVVAAYGAQAGWFSDSAPASCGPGALADSPSSPLTTLELPGTNQGNGAPFPAVIDPTNGLVYVANSLVKTPSLDNVTVISPLNRSIIAEIRVGNISGAPAVDPANGALYVPTFRGVVAVISTATNSVVASIPVGLHPLTPVYDPADGALYVPNWHSNSVSIISGQNGSVVSTVPVGSGPRTPTVDPLNDQIYVPDSNSSTVTVISGRSSTVVAAIAVGPDPQTPTFDPANGDLYIGSQSNGASDAEGLTVISGANDSVVATFSMPNGTYRPAYDSANGDLYVVSAGQWPLTVIASSTNQVLSTIPDSWLQGAGAPAYDPANGDVYIPSNALRMDVLSTWTNTVVGYVSTGAGLSTPTVDPTNGFVYTTDWVGHDSVEVRIISGGGPTPELYRVTFSAPSNASSIGWRVSLDGSPHSLSQGLWWNDHSVVFAEPNGTYAYTVTSLSCQYSANPGLGSVTVAGSPASVSVSLGLKLALV